MSKKQFVKALLEQMSTIKDIPTSKDGHTIDMEKLPDHPIVKSTITLLINAGVDYDYLCKNGFVAAAMLIGRYLKPYNK